MSRFGVVVRLGAQLDGWELGTGAHDDCAGVATVIAAAHLIAGGAPPRRAPCAVVLLHGPVAQTDRAAVS